MGRHGKGIGSDLPFPKGNKVVEFGPPTSPRKLGEGERVRPTKTCTFPNFHRNLSPRPSGLVLTNVRRLKNGLLPNPKCSITQPPVFFKSTSKSTSGINHQPDGKLIVCVRATIAQSDHKMHACKRNQGVSSTHRWGHDSSMQMNQLKKGRPAFMQTRNNAARRSCSSTIRRVVQITSRQTQCASIIRC